MKKFIIALALILCVSVLFVACEKKDNYDDEEETTKGDNVEDNVAMLVDELNKFETLEEALGESFSYTQTEINFEEFVSELGKISGQGSTEIKVLVDGKNQGSISGEIAIKDKNLYATATNVGTMYGVSANINDSMQLIVGTWYNEKKSGNGVEALDAYAFDLESIFEEYQEQLDEYYDDYYNATFNDIPIDLSEIKLPTITADDITYEDGKYVINKDFIYDAIIFTADSIIDAMKNSGEELSDDFDDEYEELKDQLKDAFDVMHIEMYYNVMKEKITGYGFMLELHADEIAEKFEIEDYENGDIKLAYEATQNNFNFKFEYTDETDFVNFFGFDAKYITEGKKVCGIEAEFDMSVKQLNEDETKTEKYYGYSYDIENTETISSMNLKMMIDLSKFEKANSDVIDISMTVENDVSSYTETGMVAITGDEETKTVFSKSNVQTNTNVSVDFSMKTTDPNKADIDFDMTTKVTQNSNGNKQSDSSKISIEGKLELSNSNVQVPEAPESVKKKMEKAAKNPIDSIYN